MTRPNLSQGLFKCNHYSNWEEKEIWIKRWREKQNMKENPDFAFAEPEQEMTSDDGVASLLI